MNHESPSRLRGSLIAITVAAILGQASVATAQSQAPRPKQFDISDQLLSTALNEFGRQSDRQILFSTEVVNAKRTQGVKGELEPEAALRQLLNGTGLTYRVTSDDTILVEERRTGRMGREKYIHLAQADDTSLTSVEEGRRAETALEEIIVTAQKRVERLIDTPQSVSVLSADHLSRSGAVQFRDFADTVPGLSFTTTGTGFRQVNLRGVTSGTDISATVATYLDDVPYGSSSAFTGSGQDALDVALFDLQRIEVLRGPQGTLYGAASMGGLIKYVTRPPDIGGFSGSAQAGISNTDEGGTGFRLAGAVNVPVLDTAALRVSAFESREGGYIDNAARGREDVNRGDTYGGRLDFLFTPTDALSVRISGFMQNIARDGLSTADYTAAGAPVSGDLVQQHRYAEPFDQKYRLASGTVTYQFEGAELTSISSYQTLESEANLDVSAQFVPLLSGPNFGSRAYSAVGSLTDSELDKFTQEVRLASTGKRTVDWLVGAVYTDEKARRTSTLPALTLSGEPVVPNDLLLLTIPSKYEDIAGFADLTYHFTEKFDVTGGVRYAHNKQTVTQNGSGLFGTTRPERTASENVTTYLANARYHFSDRATGYMRFATGYRPGGPNIVLNNPATGQPLAQPTFDSDSLKSYEAGFKAESDSGAFGFDVAGFFIDWSDIQIVAVRNGVGVRTNAGEASVRGAELTLNARMLEGLTMTGAFAYIDAHLDEPFPDLGGAKGERLINVPRVTAALHADYEFSPSGLQPTAGATVRHVTERKAAFGPTAYRLPEYTSVDLRGGIQLSSVGLQLYVHNLFDERGQFSELNLGGAVQVAIQQPRTFGFLTTMQF